MIVPTRLREYIATLDPEENYKIVRFDSSDGKPSDMAYCKSVEYEDESGLYHLSVDQPAISSVVIKLNAGTVRKTVSTFSEFGILEREVGWLTELQFTGVVPRLLSHTADTLTLNYRGEPVRQYNLPDDWRRQAANIISALSEHGCSHNDIKCDNLVVLDGTLSLIDFGWATRIGDDIPSNWPQGIGRQHRLDIHRFDDEKAIFEALLSAERNMIDKSIVMKR
jgi:hypothetical protein